MTNWGQITWKYTTKQQQYTVWQGKLIKSRLDFIGSSGYVLDKMSSGSQSINHEL